MKTVNALAIVGASVWIDVTAAEGHVSKSLVQHRGSVNPVHHIVHAASKYANRLGGSHYVTAPETLDRAVDFWYGTFDVGDSKNLSLAIDTGSSDVGVNPGLYKPSPASKNLNESNYEFYATTEIDGCGLAQIKFAQYTDDVHFEGLTTINQGLYSVIATTPPNNDTVTQLPRGGIVGMAGNSTEDSEIQAVPFFYNLCEQHQVEECRFGLALGHDGCGTQTLGGVNEHLFDGPLVRFPSSTTWEVSGDVVLNGSPVFKDVTIVLDMGTPGITGPVNQTRDLFEKAGMQTETVHIPGCEGGVFGYYACDAPPTLGFSFGTKTKNQTPVFDLSADEFKLADNGNNNCTAWVTGINFPIWIVGQSWFQGRYLDFDYTSQTVGVAPLKQA